MKYRTVMNTKKTRLLSILFAFVMSMTGVSAFAHDIAVANSGVTIYYTWQNNKTELAVSFRGSSFNAYSNEYSGKVVIPSTVTYSGKTYRVTSIGNDAFYNCSSLTSVTIGNNVTTIGEYAFGNSSLTSVTIPNSVTKIGNNAFDGCNGLTSVTIPNSVTTIGKEAFTYCSGLTRLTIPSSVINLGEGAFTYCSGLTYVSIPSSLTSIEKSVFSYCSNLTSVTIPSSVTTIGNFAFQFCNALTSVTIPSSVTSIGNSAFYECTSLTSITIPISVSTIGDQAFNMCNSLTSVTVKMETPLTIDSYTFSNRANATLYVPAGCKAAYEAANYWKEFKRIVGPIDFADSKVKQLCIQQWEDWDDEVIIWDSNHDGELSESEAAYITYLDSRFKGNTAITSFDELRYFTGVTSIVNNAFSGCTNLTSVTLPNSVTSINDYAFSGCKKLTSVTCGDNLTSIGNGAFQGCSSLPEFHFPNRVTSIGDYAFGGCSGLTSVTIPNSVTSIREGAFAYCSSLNSITVWSGNSSYVAENGVLFNKNKSLLLCFPAGKTQPTYTIPETVTNIYSYAFAGCNITSVTIPNSVTSIGNYAFNGCSGLTSVTIEKETPLSITSNTFTNRANATLYVPAGSKAAYETANYWKEFKEIIEMEAPSPAITFADANVKAICVQNWDTDGDGELSEAEAADVTDLGTVFKGNTTITSFDELQYFTGLTNIGDETFGRCSGLTSVTIPNSVNNIGWRAFWNCSNLITVTIPNSVTSIEEEAFLGCSSITSVSIATSVTSIGKGAFRLCKGLTSVSIPNSVTTIHDETFSSCTGLTSVVIPNSVTSIGESAFGHCSSLTTITIPNSVTSIGNSAFIGCSNLTSVTIPNTVTTIGYSAFSGCSSLTSVTIPSSVTTIGNFAFSDCSSLTTFLVESGNSSFISVDGVLFNKDKTSICCYPAGKSNSTYSIPNSVISIGVGAFNDCNDLTSVTIPNSVTSIGSSAF